MVGGTPVIFAKSQGTPHPDVMNFNPKNICMFQGKSIMRHVGKVNKETTRHEHAFIYLPIYLPRIWQIDSTGSLKDIIIQGSDQQRHIIFICP